MASRWRGYEYFKSKKVSNIKSLGDDRFRAAVSGSRNAAYDVLIDIHHMRQSSCTCPHAAGKRIICKHMIAAYFTAFPKEAKDYYAAVLEEEEKYDAYREELVNRLHKYVRSLKKDEAQNLLLEVLETGPKWVWERFVREYVE